MAIARLVRQAKRPHGLWVKMAAVTVMGLCFIFVWGVFSSSSSSVTSQRESFEDIAEPVSSSSSHKPQKLRDESKKGGESEKNSKSNGNGSSHSSATRPHSEQHKGKDNKKEKKHVQHKEDKEKGNHQGSEEPQPQHGQEEKEKENVKEEVEGEEEKVDHESDVDVDVDADGGSDLSESVDKDDSKVVEDAEELRKKSKVKVKGPLFDPNASYSWKLCSSRSKHNYIPCIDIEVGGGKVTSYRHTERSCPRTPLMCLVPLPHERYGSPDTINMHAPS